MKRWASATCSIAAFVGLMLIPSLCNAQTAIDEGQIWLRLPVQKKFGKKFRVTVMPELRTDGVTPESYLGRFAARYRPVKYVAFEAAYRFEFKNKKDGFEPQHRSDFNLIGRYPIGDFTPRIRLRYTDTMNSPGGPKRRLRYQGGLSYDIGKTDVGVAASAEAFHDLDEGIVQKMRYAVEAEWKFYNTKPLDQFVEAGYRLDYHLFEERNVHIGLLSYKLVFR